MNENQLVNQVIDLVVESVNLHHMDRKTISADTALMTGGLELDSVDILEVVVAVEHKFGVKVADAESGKNNFKTIGTIVNFIETHRASPQKSSPSHGI
jgi:acyl carrier protein